MLCHVKIYQRQHVIALGYLGLQQICVQARFVRPGNGWGLGRFRWAGFVGLDLCFTLST